MLYKYLNMLYNYINQKGEGGRSMAAKNPKQTSRSVAHTASKILTDKCYSDKAKSVAGSALAQTRPKKGK